MWQFVNVNMIGDAVNDAIIFMLKNEYFYDLLELDKYLLTPKELNELKQKQQDKKDDELQLYNDVVHFYFHYVDLIEKTNFFSWSLYAYTEYGICLPSYIIWDDEKQDYIYNHVSHNEKINYCQWTYNEFLDYTYNISHLLPSKIWNTIVKIYVQQKDKKRRVKKRILSMFERGNCFFLSITFDEPNMKKTNETTRRKYVQAFLHNFTSYVANKDYGEEKGREHFHAVVLCDRIDHKLWQYGNLDFEKIHKSTKDCTLVGQYLAKLCNHAIKTSTKNSRLLYSRK